MNIRKAVYGIYQRAKLARLRQDSRFNVLPFHIDGTENCRWRFTTQEMHQ